MSKLGNKVILTRDEEVDQRIASHDEVEDLQNDRQLHQLDFTFEGITAASE